MYAPVRPRPKKTNIVRSRNGCKSCRERRTKCDEQKPACGTCLRLGRRCEPLRRDPPTEVRLQEHVHNVQLPGLQHTERDVFYLTYWEDVCLPAVHPMFRQTTAFAWQDTMLRDAVLALSSCNLSRISSKNRGPSRLDVATFSPNLVHQTRSQLYYSSAIREFASLNQFHIRFRAEMVFTVLVLFAYIESSMGNFQGFQCHVQGLENVLMELHGAMEEVTLKALLSAWMQVRFVERRVMVLSILCESHRLYSKEVLRHWNPVVGQGAMFRDKQPCSNVEPGTPSQRLTEQERKLDEWLLRLPPPEQPMILDSDPGFYSQPLIICNKSSAPLYFQTHDAALNFAYYVIARILQCTSSLEQGRTPGPDRSARVCVEDDWVRLLIRIARGTRMPDSISRNSYTIGFSDSMLAAVLRCQNASLGTEIQSWMEELEKLQPTEEGAFPIYQTLAVVRAVNRRREIEREVFGVTLPTDDAGGTPKFTVYNSQTISALLFHERYLIPGELSTQMENEIGSV
ncbi:hypothetical protein BDV19DRAFT_382308 [Aspergillus venezuelensis]